MLIKFEISPDEMRYLKVVLRGEGITNPLPFVEIGSALLTTTEAAGTIVYLLHRCPQTSDVSDYDRNRWQDLLDNNRGHLCGGRYNPDL